MFAKVTRGLFVVALTSGLAACNAGNPAGGLDVAGSEQAQQQQQQQAVASVVQGTCPPIALRDGTAFFRTYAKGAKDDPQQVVYQASLADTTRSCSRNDAGQLTITVMVQGRLISGPQGKAGTLSMPIRVSVVDGDQVLYSEITKFDAALADVNQPSQFVFTKDVTGIPGEISRLALVSVGFDDGTAKTKTK
ncbi:hypothetical protein M8R20_04305 [Pseudomonas sp. R2.Fl]|nr:hypothetical protein [Pseudomonas sp. R2.Fl]